MPGDSILSLPPVAADKRIHYGADPNQFGDLFLPKSGLPPSKTLHPVLMFVHGGYWRARYDLLYASRFCRALADSGIAVWCLEYRRIGNSGGGWPGTFEDILAGWSALRRISSDHAIDLKRAMLCGHSAGAQLAMALSSRNGKLDPRPRALFSLAGVLDLQLAYDLHLSNDAVVEFLGGTPKQVPDHYAEANPMRLHIAIPQVLFHGVPDEDVPVALSRTYYSAKHKAGERVLYNQSPSAGHFDWVDPRTPEFQQVLHAVSN
ncbi:MAG: alpha/beta hydrolase [Acidobacteriaceae bacterium]